MAYILASYSDSIVQTITRFLLKILSRDAGWRQISRGHLIDAGE